MPRLACPFCYHRIDGAMLWYQCMGKGSADRDGCLPIDDAARRRETGFAEPMLPTFPPPRGQRWRPTSKAYCPDCDGGTGMRACPCCHTPLPANFGESRGPLIAMVGAKGTGKTVYMTVLARELRSPGLRRRFDADIRLTGDGQGGFRSPLQWLENNVDRMFVGHQLFPATTQAIKGRQEPLVFEWRAERRSWLRDRRMLHTRPVYNTSYLSFYDTAGEDLSRQAQAYDLEYIGAADALILLLDPFMLPKARERLNLPDSAITSTEATIDVLSRVTESLRAYLGVPGHRRIRKPLAVAFAKMDAFFEELGEGHPLRREPGQVPAYDDALGRDTHEHVRALLRGWQGDDIDTHLRFNYETFRYFFVSALGAPPDYDNAMVDDGGVRPYRVNEPLLWLLSRFGVVPRQARR
ncbi:hypothetical protein [Plantactinospora sp. WMMB782]|uniref:hypothetical protein n=1 Tax=Plantactinospora sp. WMMB782 TaxID=3404121 RepID=UPI003B95F13A